MGRVFMVSMLGGCDCYLYLRVRVFRDQRHRNIIVPGDLLYLIFTNQASISKKKARKPLAINVLRAFQVAAQGFEPRTRGL